MIGQDLDAPTFHNRKNWRSRSSVHVVMDGTHIQVDAAPELRIQCLNNNITQTDLFILTHEHADHIMGMDDLRRFNDLNNFEALPVYSNEEGLERVRAIYHYAIEDGAPKMKGYPRFSLHEMPECLELDCGTIETFHLPHGSINVLGLLFTEKSSGKRFAYFTDCKEVPEPAQKAASSADLLVLDALREKPHPTHLTIAEATALAQKIGAPQTYFIHINFDVDHDSVESSLPEGINLSHDGLRVSL